MDYAEDMICEKSVVSKDDDVVDIDSNLKDPQACSLYAPDIYDNIRIAEVCPMAITIRHMLNLFTIN